MTRITLDGNEHQGRYRGQCECGDAWNGSVPHSDIAGYVPALPVADAIVHMKLCHHSGLVDLVFTNRFRLWLEAYWARCSESDSVRLNECGTMPRRVTARVSDRT